MHTNLILGHTFPTHCTNSFQHNKQQTTMSANKMTKSKVFIQAEIYRWKQNLIIDEGGSWVLTHRTLYPTTMDSFREDWLKAKEHTTEIISTNIRNQGGAYRRHIDTFIRKCATNEEPQKKPITEQQEESSLNNNKRSRTHHSQ